MSVTVDCPDQAKLAQHARNELAQHTAADLDRHLAACRSCLHDYLELGRKTLAPEVPECHIIKEIGRGRFGVVYKAWSLAGEPRIVALKVLSCPGEMEQSRFDREIAVLKKIDSPWITKCLESGKTGESMYYTMDFVEGMHLDQHLAKSTADLNGKLAVFTRVCRAVADAHAQGVIHRDLKPRNILIDAEGQPHLLDFGICALESPDWSSGARSTITHPGDVVGTLKYMSPEQAWGGVAGPTDERCDIWSLGIMLYEIVTGGGYPYSLKPSPDRPAHEAILDRIRRELPRLPRLDSLPRGRDLEILLERCLAWEPDRRIQSAAVLAEDLDRYRTGKRIKTKALWFPYRLKRLAVGAATRSRWLFFATFIAALGVTLSAVAYLFNVGWEATGHRYHQQPDDDAIVAASQDARDAITVVGVFDDTVDALPALARNAGIDGVTENVRSWRAVHGRIMERLASVRPKAVVWDYHFRTFQPGDTAFVSGVERLEEAGCPVLLAALTYDQSGTPNLSPAIRDALGRRLRHGAITARDMVQRPGEFVVALKREPDMLVPSLALATLAAVLHPDSHLDVEWPARRHELGLLYEVRPGAYLRGRDRIGLTTVFKAPRTEHSVQTADLLGCSKFPLARPEEWEKRTVRYETLLTCSDEDLRALAAGKVVVVGDLRAPRLGFADDRKRVRFGLSVVEDVPGCYLLADAIAGLLNRRYLKTAFPLPPATLLMIIVAAMLGCLIPVMLATRSMFQRRRHRRVFWLSLIAASALCLTVMVIAKSYTAVHVGMVGFSVLAPLTGALWVELARNRHRILDSHRRAFDEPALRTAGTVTLASKRWRSLQEEQ